MTATYTNDPLNRPIDRVRHEINDTDTENAVLSDEEIQYSISSNPHVLLAASDCAAQIGAKYADEPKQKTVGDLSINYGGEGRSATYQALAKRLRDRAIRRVGDKIFAGGISESDRDATLSDTDRTRMTMPPGRDDYGGEETDDGIYR